MKKLSNMGGGEFEFYPFGLDKKINKREEYFEKSLEDLENLIDKLGTEYVKEELEIKENFEKDVKEELEIKENFEKDVIRRMMLKRM